MKPRTNKPEKGNKYYINISNGGYNGARGNPLRLNKELTSLPNCVMIYGWFNEVGQQGMKYLKAPWYPYSVINAAKREGLTITKEPTIGGIMVWTGGKTGEGHVAGVGEIINSTKIFTVESEYYGRDWATFWRTKGDGNWRDGCSWMNKSYIYQGCIKNPFIEEEKDLTKEETEKLIKEMFPEQWTSAMNEYLEYQANRSDTWATVPIKEVEKLGIMVGTPTGFHPNSWVTRAELAQTAMNIINYLSK